MMFGLMFALLTATPANFQAPLAAAKCGDTVQFAAGNYPIIRIYNLKPACPVVVDLDAATIENVAFIGASNWTLSKGNYGPCVYACVQGSGSDHLTVDRAHMHDMGTAGVSFTGSQHLTVTYVRCERSSGDCVDVAASQYVDIEDIDGVNNVPTPIHPDVVALWSIVGQPAIAHVVIKNVTIAGPSQGVDLFDHAAGGGSDIDVENVTCATTQVWCGEFNGVTSTRLVNNTAYTIMGAPWQPIWAVTDQQSTSAPDSGKSGNSASGNINGAKP